nr:10881_t:CDS:2 [Entrophospora candida]
MKQLNENTPVRRSKRIVTVSSKSIVDYSDSSNYEGLYILLDTPELLSKSASSFNLEDTKALNVKFAGSGNQNRVIPGLDTEIPAKLLLPNISEMDFGINVNRIKDLELSNDAKSFFYQMSKMVKNEGVVIGTSEAKTDTVVTTILHSLAIVWPLNLSQHPLLFFNINEHKVKADPEFTIKSLDINIIIVEHLKNISVDNGCGEPQIAAELLAAAYENRQRNVLGDQVLFAVRFICSYVTFYCFEVSNNYFRELAIGLPVNEHIIMTRWPVQNTKTSGIDLKTADGRHQVLRCLIALCNHAKNHSAE